MATTVLPFGRVTNAPATLMRLMNDVSHPLLDQSSVVYLDDIFIFSKNPEKHLRHLSQASEILNSNQLYARLSKCTIMKSSVEYLGVIIDSEGLHVESKKIAAIKDWPQPTGRIETMQFMGLASYSRKFIPHFSSIAAHLTLLLSRFSKVVISFHFL